MAKRSELDDVSAANKDVLKRFEREPITVSYDEEFDIFVMRLGDPAPAITEEVVDGLNLRLDPESLRFLAFEVLGFKRRFLKAHPEFCDLYQSLFGESSPMIRRNIPRTSHHRRTAQDVVGTLLSGLSLGSPHPA